MSSAGWFYCLFSQFSQNQRNAVSFSYQVFHSCIYVVKWNSHIEIRMINILLFKSVQINLLFHPFSKFHKSVMGILWAGIPHLLREHCRRIFPGILGPVQPQQQLILSATAVHFEITQVAELSVSLTGSLWRTWNENNKRSEEDGQGAEVEEGKYRRGGKRCIFQMVNNLSA